MRLSASVYDPIGVTAATTPGEGVRNMAKKNKEEQENTEMVDESSLTLDNSESDPSANTIDSEADAALSYNSYLDPNQTPSTTGAAYYDPDDAITRTNDATATDDATASMDSYMGTNDNPALMDTLENYAGGSMPPIDYTNPTTSYQPSNGNYGQGQDSAQMWQEQFGHLRQQLANGLQKLSSATQNTSDSRDTGAQIQLGDFKRLASLIGGGFFGDLWLGPLARQLDLDWRWGRLGLLCPDRAMATFRQTACWAQRV